MGIKLGNTEINKQILGNTEVNKMYLGDNLIFENVSNPRPSLLTSYNQASNTLDVTVIATPINGNYLVAQIALGNYSSDPIAPAGWTKAHETVNGFGAHAFFVKESDGTETAITFSKTGGNGQVFMASVHEFSNVSDALFYSDLQVSTRTQSTNVNIPSLTSKNDSSLAVSFVTALNANNVDDSLTTAPSDYNISSEYSSGLGQGAWNMVLTQECEDVILASDNIVFDESVIHSTLNMVLNPITITNLYPHSNAAGNDTNSYDDWNWTSSISVASVTSTDSILEDDFAIRLEARNDGLTSSSTSHVVTGLSQGQEYKAIIRCRAMVTGGNASNVFFNWNNVTNTTYNGTIIGTDWEEVEILFTPTNSSSFTLKAYPFYNSGGNSLTGDFLEISSIVIEEVVPESSSLYISGLQSLYSSNSIDGSAVLEGDAITVWEDSISSYNVTPEINSPVLHIDAVTGNKQVRFNGIDTVMTALDNTVHNYIPQTDEFTIIVKLGESLPENVSAPILGKSEDVGSKRQYDLIARPSRWSFRAGGTSKNHYGNTVTGRDLAIWSVGLATHNLRANGVLATSENSVGSSTTNNKFTIGGRRGNYPEFLSGDIEFIAIYNRLLTTQEITDIESEFNEN